MKKWGRGVRDITPLLGSQRPRCDLYASLLSCNSEGSVSSIASVMGGGMGRNKDRNSCVSGISNWTFHVRRGLLGNR